MLQAGSFVFFVPHLLLNCDKVKKAFLYVDIDSGYHFGSDRIIIIMIIIHSCTASIPFNLNNIVAIWLGMVLVVINQYVALVAAYLYNHRQYCCNNIITGFPFLCGLPLWVQTRNQNRHCILITTLLGRRLRHTLTGTVM